MIYSALKKLPKESQPKLTKLIRLDTNILRYLDDVYNFNDKDKLSMINNDSDKYMKHLKKDIGTIKTILKTISANQSDSHHNLMKLLN